MKLFQKEHIYSHKYRGGTEGKILSKFTKTSDCEEPCEDIKW